jgi:hypothetical protein
VTAPARTARLLIGMACIAIGLVWIAQGTGHLGGSVMTGESMWTWIGAAVAAVGVVLVVLGLRRRAPTDQD